MVQKVVIAFDHSPQAQLALKVARAHFPQAERHLLMVIEEQERPLPSAGHHPDLDIARALVDIRTATWPQESSQVLIGERVPTLLRAAGAFGADLLVIGTHGRRGLNRWLSGSVAEEVIRQADLPVLVIREASVFGDECPEAPDTDGPPTDRSPDPAGDDRPTVRTTPNRSP